jgi:dUTP pyrophosphatase
MDGILGVRIARINPDKTDIPLPHYATEGSAGMDICAAVEKDTLIYPNDTALIPTGLIIELPQGYEAQIRPRSGLAIKHNVGILNSPGTIDSDYRGEVKIILTNFGKTPFTIRRGDRIAQMIISRYERVLWEESGSLAKSLRGEGGFGHTGITLSEDKKNGPV